MTTPHSYSSVETWKSLSDYFFGAIVPQWRSLQLNPESCNTKLPSTLLKDMLKLCSMLVDATETTMEKGAPVPTQKEECLQSVDADSHEKTEVTGAKEGIVTEISVDNCGDNKRTETPELETEASACLEHVDTQSQTTATAEPRKSCMKKKSTADTKDLDKIEPCAMKKPAMPAAYESDVDNRKETEAKGAKDSILKEISVDNCGDNKITDTPELETEAGKCLQHVDTQSQATAEPKKSCMKKKPPADTKDWDKIEACPVEKPVIPAVHESEVDSSSVISLASDDLSAEKMYVYAVIQLVVSRALKKVSSKHKDSTWILTPKSNCHRLLEKIWPEIEGKHLDLSPKRLTSIEKAIFTNLCKAHRCKEKHLISSLKEELEDDITVPTFTKHLLALPKRVLTLSKNRDEYRELVERFAKDLVMHAMSNTNEAGKLPLGADEAIKERLAQKVWAKIVSQKLKISLEDIEEVSVTVYNELREKWKYPNTVMQLMKIGHRNVDKEIVKSFIRNAPLKRPNIFSRMFSCACFT
ncbi:unnamed protein product [Oreochromis niloticus]|nr:unnamed protein product [Mustela putorius furo]